WRFPESLPPIEYDFGDLVRKADKDGDISFKNRHLRLGKPFRGERIALRPTAEDGIFSIHFCSHQIGQIDLRAASKQACGVVDIAMPTDPCGQTPSAMPTTPQAPQQQTLDNRS